MSNLWDSVTEVNIWSEYFVNIWFIFFINNTCVFLLYDAVWTHSFLFSLNYWLNIRFFLSDLLRAAFICIERIIITTRHISTFKLKKKSPFFVCFSDHMTKEPVEDTDPSTLSFHMVGHTGTFIVISVEWYFSKINPHMTCL